MRASGEAKRKEVRPLSCGGVPIVILQSVPRLSLRASHPPGVPGLEAAAVFVWLAETRLPLLDFHQVSMWGRRWDGPCSVCEMWRYPH